MAATATATRKTVAIINTHAKKRQSITLALIKALLGIWGSYDGGENRAILTSRAAKSAVEVDKALGQTRRLARTYAKTMLSTADALPRTLPALENVYPRSGAEAQDVYARPADVFLWARKNGATKEEARVILNQRLQELAEMDVILAERQVVTSTFAAAQKVTGYRRVIHPELSRTGTCGLCVIASDRVYRTGELMPMHDHCKCSIAPITAGFDAGQQMNRADLDEIYKAAGGNYRDVLKDVRVQVDEHGELGPYLNRAGKRRGVEETNALGGRHKATPYSNPTLAEQRTKWEHAIERSKAWIRELKEAEAAGRDASRDGKTVSDYATAINYHQSLIDRFRAALNS